MKRLKADVHAHTSDDPLDSIPYSAYALIDGAAEAGLDVFAITCHLRQTCAPAYREYAAERGILLIPGVELILDRRHVLVLNPDPEQCEARSFAAFCPLRGRGEVVIAPHPFFPQKNCLRELFAPNADLFDAIEYCSMYLPGVNFNRRALIESRARGLPLVGSTDTHHLPYRHRTISWIHAEKNQESVLQAIRAGRVDVASVPSPLIGVLTLAWNCLWKRTCKCVYRGQEETVSS